MRYILIKEKLQRYRNIETRKMQYNGQWKAGNMEKEGILPDKEC